MSSIPALHTGLNAIQSGINTANKHAADIARAGTDSQQDLTSALIGLNSSEQQVAAAAKVVQASSDMIGTLLDIEV